MKEVKKNQKQAFELNKISKDKYKQLELDFNDFFPVAPVETVDLDKLKKMYLPVELTNYPFFFQSQSQIVNKSRRYFNQKFQKLKPDKNLSIEPDALKQEFSFSQDPEEEKLIQAIHEDFEKADENSNVTHKLQYNWTVKADWEYGLPDDFDGMVWDVILQKISTIFRRHNKFFQWYSFSIYSIFTALQEQGYFKSKSFGGYYSERIKHSLLRLNATKYIQTSKGFFRKDKKDNTTTQYAVSLISSIIWRGESIDGQTYAKDTAISIDPLFLLNFIHNRYFISANQTRYKISNYKARNLYDKISKLTSGNLQNKFFHFMLHHNYKPFVMFRYENLCQFLNYKPYKDKNLKPKEIKKQLASIHKQLIDNQVISHVLINKINNQSEKAYKIIYLLEPEFIYLVDSLNPKNQRIGQQELPKELQKSFFQYFNSISLTQKERKYILGDM